MHFVAKIIGDTIKQICGEVYNQSNYLVHLGNREFFQPINRGQVFKI